jgi:hypothetical protein
VAFDAIMIATTGVTSGAGTRRLTGTDDEN